MISSAGAMCLSSFRQSTLSVLRASWPDRSRRGIVLASTNHSSTFSERTTQPCRTYTALIRPSCRLTPAAFEASGRRTIFSSSTLLHSNERNQLSSPKTGRWQRARGRTCLLTGATSGIGYEVLKALLQEGASQIQIVTRDKSRGLDAVESAIEETGVDSVPIKVLELHLGKLSDSQAFPAELIASPGDGSGEAVRHVDTFIHCAGRSQSSLSFKTSMAEVQDIIGTNLLSYTSIASQLLHNYHKLLKKIPNNKPSVCVVGVSSLLAQKSGYGASTYAASKAALIAYNRSLSLEASAISSRQPDKPKFRVNTVVPGYIDTPMLKDAGGNNNQKLLQEIPLGRFGDPQEVADAIMFLIGNEYAHNCVVNIDGGLSGT